MGFKNSYKSSLFQITEENFKSRALELFYYQAENNEVYRRFIDYLKINVSSIKNLKDIPFMPIDFFKRHEIKTDLFDEEIIFTSSGTSGANTSRHFVSSIEFYLSNTIKNFELFYDKIDLSKV